MDKREFAKTTLNGNSETFVVYVAIYEAEALIYLLGAAQIADL